MEDEPKRRGSSEAYDSTAPAARPSRAAGSPEGSWHTVRDVALRLKISERTVRRWIDLGLLRTRKFGRCVRISQRALDELEG